MNTNAIKRHAPKARTAFIAAMSKRAALLGIRESSVPSFGIAPLEIKGDLAPISDSAGNQRTFPASIARAQRWQRRSSSSGSSRPWSSWFNHLCALRYIEIKGYLEHSRRVFSAADGSVGTPQILDDCLDIEFEGLDRSRITKLKTTLARFTQTKTFGSRRKSCRSSACPVTRLPAWR